MRGVGAPHRRLATARTDLKASGELAWTMLVLNLFQAIMVRGKKDCTVQCYSLGFLMGRHILCAYELYTLICTDIFEYSSLKTYLGCPKSPPPPPSNGCPWRFSSMGVHG